jgi:hypothetical protein
METCENCQRPEVCKYAGSCLTSPATDKLIARRSAAACSPSSDTPETDKKERALGGCVSSGHVFEYARKLERERNIERHDAEAFAARCIELHSAIRETIMDNLHLADGDKCTLKRLKDVIKFKLPPENAEVTRGEVEARSQQGG